MYGPREGLEANHASSNICVGILGAVEAINKRKKNKDIWRCRAEPCRAPTELELYQRRLDSKEYDRLDDISEYWIVFLIVFFMSIKQ